MMAKLKWVVLLLFLCSSVICAKEWKTEVLTRDISGPQITMKKKKIKTSVNASEEEWKKGLRAVDQKDGDVTDSIVIENMSAFLKPGRRLITYAAFDQDHHVTKATRELEYTDYHSPEIFFSRPLRFPAGTRDILSGIRVQDCIDGDISGKVRIAADTTFYVDVPGSYPVKLQVANSCGDLVTLPVTLEIYDRTEEEAAMQIHLLDAICYLEKGTSFDPLDEVQSITVDGLDYALTEEEESYGTQQQDGYRTISRSRLEIEQDMDLEKAGVYEINYRINGENGKNGKTRLVVVVQNKKKKKGDA